MARIPLLILFLLLCSTTVLGAADYLTGLTAYWPVDTVVDERTGNVSYTTANGAAAIINNGSCAINGCLKLDGSASFLTFNDTKFPTGDVTETQCWYMVGAPYTGGAPGVITHGTDVSGNRYYSFVGPGGGPVKVKVGNYGANSGASTSALSSGTLYDFCTVKSGSSVSFYLDGQPDGTSTLTGTNIMPSYGAIGELATGGEYFFGYLDELYVYSRALTAEDVSGWHNVTRAGGQWPFLPNSTREPGIRFFGQTDATNESISMEWGTNGTISLITLTRNSTTILSTSNSSYFNETLLNLGLLPARGYNYTLTLTAQNGSTVSRSLLMFTEANSAAPSPLSTGDALLTLGMLFLFAVLLCLVVFMSYISLKTWGTVFSAVFAVFSFFFSLVSWWIFSYLITSTPVRSFFPQSMTMILIAAYLFFPLILAFYILFTFAVIGQRRHPV